MVIASSAFTSRTGGHAWVGVEGFLPGRREPVQILAHVKLDPSSSTVQKTQIGQFATNMAYAFRNHPSDPDAFFKALSDDVAGQMSVDSFTITGAGIDFAPATVSSQLGKVGLRRGALLGRTELDNLLETQLPAGASAGRRSTAHGILEASQDLTDFKARFINLNGGARGSILEIGGDSALVGPRLLKAPFSGSVFESTYLPNLAGLKSFGVRAQGTLSQAQILNLLTTEYNRIVLTPDVSFLKKFAMLRWERVENGRRLITYAWKGGEGGRKTATLTFQVAAATSAEDIGKIGVNVLHGLQSYADNPSAFSASLLEGLPKDTAQLSSVHFTGAGMAKLAGTSVPSTVIPPHDIDFFSYRFKGILEKNSGDPASLTNAMNQLNETLPTVTSRANEDVVSALTREFQSRFPNQAVRILAPTTLPQSGSQVYVVSVNGVDKQVVKIYSKNPLLFAQELASQQTVRATKPTHYKLPELVSAFTFQSGSSKYPALVMNKAAGEDVKIVLNRNLTSSSPQALKQSRDIVKDVADAVADFHKGFIRSNDKSPDILQYMKMETDRARTLLSEVDKGAGANAQWISGAELTAMRAKLGGFIDQFAKDGPSQVALVHGDLHTGNMLWQNGSTTLIDFETAARGTRVNATGAITPNADPLSDVARFVGSLYVDAAADKAKLGRVENISNLFIDTYAKDLGLSRQQVREGVQYHINRYYLLQLSPTSRLPVNEQCFVMDLMLRQLQIRAPNAAVPCP
jgi:hypothetical protein